MIYYNQIINKEDYLKKLDSTVIRDSFVADGPTIPANSCAFNESYQAFRINDSTTDQKGAIEINTTHVMPGDTVEAEVEVMNVSGDQCRIGADLFSDPSFSNGSYVESYEQLISINADGFQKLKVKYTIEKEGWFQVAVGVFTGNVGDFYLRNIKVKVDTSASTYGDTPLKEKKRMFKIRGSASGLFISEDFGTDKGTITINSTSKFITLFYDEPLPGTLKSLVFVQNNMYAHPNYQLLTHGELEGQVFISIYDTDTNTLVDPALIENDTAFSISVLVKGFDA